ALRRRPPHEVSTASSPCAPPRGSRDRRSLLCASESTSSRRSHVLQLLLNLAAETSSKILPSTQTTNLLFRFGALSPNAHNECTSRSL
ncbi:jg17703, partial [Pararge aegeria aegeria]